MSVVLLSGGSGGAKLARGLYEILGSDLTVIANTGDDVEAYGAHVSPDPDLVGYWLADRIDPRGWGLAGDSFEAVAMFKELGFDGWFNLGDRDLAFCLARTRLIGDGLTQTAAQARLLAALGVSAAVVPMSDQPVRTRVLSGGRWLGLQEFIVRLSGEAPIEDIEFAGVTDALPSPAALPAIAAAATIVIGPSNPIISIGPILALPGMREALRASGAPIVAVSPIVGGAVLKGPTGACMAWAGVPLDASGVIACYDGLLDGLVCDEPVETIRSLRCDTRMDDAEQRVALARRALEFAGTLA
ncbi:MAG TPA: 2-phospho-L-lactate transferase CofD family protein [Solirubrobacteraceae bacterium]|nr:2-phospho-L-lactate transferase CofD family protein [Solirubrobacteraceae bacterium]